MLVGPRARHKGLSGRYIGMRSCILAGVVATAATSAQAVPKVAADILPVQSIVAAVMQGLSKPDVILEPGASPHGYSLRPSDARVLSSADIVVWVGPGLDPWLADPLAALAPGAVRIALDDAPGIAMLPIRVDGPFEAHDHGHEEPEHDHALSETHDHEHEHEHGGAHGQDGYDSHLWLDPANAAAAARTVAEALAAQDPENAGAYAANAEAFAAEMTALGDEVEGELAPLRGEPYLVFHDAFQYFESAFDFPAAGSISLQDGVEPGPARVASIRDRVVAGQIVCGFTEPAFPPKLMATIAEGTGLRTGTLDPMGTDIPPGPGLYAALIRDLAANLKACLAPDA